MAPKKSTPAGPSTVSAATRKALANPNGFSPEVWGPSMWFMMHLAAATFPEAPTATDRAQYAAFFQSLQYVLPCFGCRKGYEVIINSDPTKLTARTFTSRAALFKWTVDVHNRVNAKLGKPIQSDWVAWYREYDKLR